MEELLSYLNQVATSAGWPLSPECLDRLREIIRPLTLKKDEMLLTAGEVCTNIYFIRKGLLKCYYILHEKDITDWLFAEWDTVVSVDSYYDQVPGVDFIQAREDCELFYISFEELEHLYSTFVEFNAVGRVLTNKYLRAWHGMARITRMQRAKERYESFLERHGEMVNRASMKDLASLLDMAPETLSRMRRLIN
jgi:CRP-like cAMP-binding protein